MQTQLFERFAPVIRSLTASELNGSPSLYDRLRIAQDGKIGVCYTPFEFINPQAKVVIVGITPGRTQFLNAIREARRQLDLGADTDSTLFAAKQTGAFSGELRPNLIGLLDHVGVNRWLGLQSSSALFGPASNLVQTTSLLRNAVFVNGENYNGSPVMTKHPLLREQLLTHFTDDARHFPDAVFIPLGDKVAEGLRYLVERGVIGSERVLDGIPHPSPHNIERIRYFLGKKLRSDLSKKTNPDKLDRDRAMMLERISALG